MVHYIANTFFELELENHAENDFKKALGKNIFKQLHYLPLLYLSPEDTLLVTEYPAQEYLDSLDFPLPKIEVLQNDFRGEKLQSWGASDLIARWSKNKLEMPSLSIAKKINSKLWNFQNTVSLPGARIIFRKEEIKEAVANTAFDWVLKTDQGFAGRGNLVFNAQSLDKALNFAEKHAKAGIILEPWVERVFDFSSQWVLSKEGEITLLGLTKCINTPRGVYLGTETGTPALVFGEFLPQVMEHVDYCKTYLKKVVAMGFFGPLGIDAMVYNKTILHPIVEINARMAMSAAIFLYHQLHGKNEVTRIYYCDDNSNKKSLLPEGYHRKLIIM